MINENDWRELLRKLTETYCDFGYPIEKTLDNIKKTLIIAVEDEWYCIGVYDERQIEKGDKKSRVGSD